jgi:hypothetical protein
MEEQMGQKTFSYKGHKFDVIGILFVFVVPFMLSLMWPPNPDYRFPPKLLMYAHIFEIETFVFGLVTLYFSVRPPKFKTQGGYRRFMLIYNLILLAHLGIPLFLQFLTPSFDQ